MDESIYGYRPSTQQIDDLDLQIDKIGQMIEDNLIKSEQLKELKEEVHDLEIQKQ